MVCDPLELTIRSQSKLLVLAIYLNDYTSMDSHNNGHFPIPLIVSQSGTLPQQKHQSQYVVFFVESDAIDRFILTSAIIQAAP